ncbi:MAG: hypothetical protein ACRCZ9_12365 [Fusobacteriaceae bacterium]
MISEIFIEEIRKLGYSGILDLKVKNGILSILNVNNIDSYIRLSDIWSDMMSICDRYGVYCIRLLDVSNAHISPWDKYGFSGTKGGFRYLFINNDIDVEDINLLTVYMRSLLNTEIVYIDVVKKIVICDSLTNTHVRILGYKIQYEKLNVFYQ